jgi:hypothetical protein
MKTKYLYIILMVLFASCTRKVNDELSIEPIELESAKTEKIKTFEFIAAADYPHFNGGFGFANVGSGINDRNTGIEEINAISGFDEYFKLENNVVINKDTSTPFTGKIILYRQYSENSYDEIPTKIARESELHFENGFLFQFDYTSYRPSGVIWDRGKYNVFSFFNDQKQMKYYFHTLESYKYFDRQLPDGTIVNNLINSMVAEENMPGPGILYKITDYYTDGIIYEEGYGQLVIVPHHFEADEHYGRDERIGWTWELSRVGIWKEYSRDGECFNEKMWGIKKVPIEDIKTYRFND